jgi:endonuclease YncB( thermonuclease family)
MLVQLLVLAVVAGTVVSLAASGDPGPSVVVDEAAADAGLDGSGAGPVAAAAPALDAERLARSEARAAAKERAEATLAASRERYEQARERSAAAVEAAEARAAEEAERAAAAEAAQIAKEQAEAARVAAEAEAAEAARRAATWTVVHVVDGDTVDVRAGDGRQERVRVIGIDTPERGECGFAEASAAMASLVQGQPVDLVAGARDDRDRYGRILRYLDVGGVDAGLALIEQGYAIARYDSRDGYGRHPREDAYVAADRATEHRCAVATPAPAQPPSSNTSSGPGSGPGGAWKNCTEAREHGAAPVLRGEPGYGSHLDRDGDGIGCE